MLIFRSPTFKLESTLIGFHKPVFAGETMMHNAADWSSCRIERRMTILRMGLMFQSSACHIVSRGGPRHSLRIRHVGG